MIKRKKIIISGCILLTLFLIMKIHEVDKTITEEDEIYIKKYLMVENINILPEHPTYLDEIKLILDVQKAVLFIAPDEIGIAYDSTREPKDLYFSKAGICYDKSRVIEKILIYLGFKTYHISVYSIEETDSFFKSIFTPGTKSHAVSGVLTQKGWLFIDSLEPWISIDSNGNPISIKQMNNELKDNTIWNSDFAPFMNPILKNNFIYIIGLYSRHGRFYPPYNFIPDINWGEFMYNFLN